LFFKKAIFLFSFYDVVNSATNDYVASYLYDEVEINYDEEEVEDDNSSLIS
jgi:hypothetical protein